MQTNKLEDKTITGLIKHYNHCDIYEGFSAEQKKELIIEFIILKFSCTLPTAISIYANSGIDFELVDGVIRETC